MAKVLVVVAHPDDESFGMGGRIAQLARNGDEVWVLTMSDGTGSRFGADEATDAEIAACRRAGHFLNAMTVLGAKVRGVLRAFPDQLSDMVRQTDINEFVELAIHGWTDLSAVYTHWRGDLNHDHQRTAAATLVACRYLDVPVYAMAPEVRKYAVPRFEPTIRVDIFDTLNIKRVACRCYVDEIRPGDHPRNPANIAPFEDFYEYR